MLEKMVAEAHIAKFAVALASGSAAYHVLLDQLLGLRTESGFVIALFENLGRADKNAVTNIKKLCFVAESKRNARLAPGDHAAWRTWSRISLLIVYFNIPGK